MGMSGYISAIMLFVCLFYFEDLSLDDCVCCNFVEGIEGNVFGKLDITV